MFPVSAPLFWPCSFSKFRFHLNSICLDFCVQMCWNAAPSCPELIRWSASKPVPEMTAAAVEGLAHVMFPSLRLQVMGNLARAWANPPIWKPLGCLIKLSGLCVIPYFPDYSRFFLGEFFLLVCMFRFFFFKHFQSSENAQAPIYWPTCLICRNDFSTTGFNLCYSVCSAHRPHPEVFFGSWVIQLWSLLVTGQGGGQERMPK